MRFFTETLKLSPEKLSELEAERQAGGRISDWVIQQGMVSEEKLLQVFSRKFDLPIESPLPAMLETPAFTEIIPIQYLRRHVMVPIETPVSAAARADDQKSAEAPMARIAVWDPTDYQPVDELARLLGLHRYQVVLSHRQEILAAIDTAFDSRPSDPQKLADTMAAAGADARSEIEVTQDLLEDDSEAPIIRLVNHIIAQSIRARASDIHLEPYRSHFAVRYRIDGMLYDLIQPPKRVQAALVSRIKVMAHLDIAEKRLPQDGRTQVTIGDQSVDVRVSTIPTAFGERVVLRLLNRTRSLHSLSDLGLSPARLVQLENLLAVPDGIMLVTGPTGSGKTTTLYAALTTIAATEKSIITIEDPVEYQIEGISQIQVNPKIELTFAKGLRSIVRQDPDVILVGEIRDRETAEIAVQSALTGHLVFSTLHTNDAAGAITRLVDIGIEPYLISSAVHAVIAQRLVRVLCSHCRRPVRDAALSLQPLGDAHEKDPASAVFRATGCDQCFQTGYRGRIGIFEILAINAEIRRSILQFQDAEQIGVLARKFGMESLRQDGREKVLAGLTSVEEVLRITRPPSTMKLPSVP